MSLFARMLVEEFRMHAELFGRRRFFAFPVVLAGLVGAGVWLLTVTGTGVDAVLAGLFALVFFFGLQVGTIGLIGRDAMRNVLGDVTLLVFSARTLPLSRRRLLGTFLVKDLVYYVGFFLTPVVIGFLPVVLEGGLSPAAVGLLWITIAAMFAFGVGTSLGLAGIATRSTFAVTGLLTGVLAAILLVPGSLIRLTPYALYADPGFESLLVSAGALTIVLVGGPLLFEPPSTAGVRRVDSNRYDRLCRYAGSMTARPLIEVVRSSGSVWKVGFSLGILFVVTALLLEQIVTETALEPSAGIAFGTLLGLGSFTTYNWVTQFDDPREYLRYPAGLESVFVGKLRAYLVLTVPTGLGYLALAGLWYPRPELALGVAVFPLVSLYVFGVTAFLTGLSPNELLFDTLLFGIYGVALAVIAVPMLVAGLAFGEYPLASAGSAIGIALVAAFCGWLLTRRSGTRWHRRLRAES